jgi:hypothetical protein
LAHQVLAPPHSCCTVKRVFCTSVQRRRPNLNSKCTNPMVGLKRLSCLGEDRRMSGREVTVGGQSWGGSIPCPIATTSRVANELPQQLSLLVSELKDRGDSLSQGRWQRWVPVSLECSQPQPVRCECLSFCHPNKLRLAQKSNSLI